jgi:hypothetical protein
MTPRFTGAGVVVGSMRGNPARSVLGHLVLSYPQAQSTGLCITYLGSCPTYSTRTLTWTFTSMLDRAIDMVGTICSFPRVRRNHSRGRSRSIARVVLLVGLLTVTTNEISVANEVRYLHSKQVLNYKDYASKVLRSPYQYACIVALWDRESHWNPKAINGDYAGIPQGGASQLLKISGYKQVAWGIAYIAGRYGVDMVGVPNACGAWAHSNLKGWY